jgi:putative FmdB family regulatory protein
MPMYEYLCQTGGHRFEQQQRIIEDALTDCIECGGPVRRVIQPVGIIFKGSGFYATDSRKSESASSASSNGSSDKSDSKSETKSESKTESKSETKSDSSKSDSASSKSSASKSTAPAAA